MHKQPFISGFTIIEMMISIGLGMLIVFTAVAGFRTASQTITAANRLSLENNLLRAGYFEAQVQLDFWTNFDSPTKPEAERPLKSEALSIGPILDAVAAGNARGLPFTSMKDLARNGIWPKSGTNPRATPTSSPQSPTNINGALCNFIVPRPIGKISDSTWELDQGWDPSYSWAPHDPRTWTRANMAEKDRNNTGRGNDELDSLPPFINGRYALFGNTLSTAQTLAVYKIKPDYNNPDPTKKMEIKDLSYTGYPNNDIHSWYYNQLNGIYRAMGYAALADYLPANAIYTWYTTGTDITVGGMNRFGVHKDYKFTNRDGDQRTSRGIYRNTYSSSYAYINPRSWDDYRVNPPPKDGKPMTGNTLRQRFYQAYDSDYNASTVDAGGGWKGGDDLRWMLSHTNWPESLIEERPHLWPDVQVSVGRLIKNAHHVAIARISRLSPYTGELIELTWSGLGSTLRGARQQRHQNTGWARWDNDPRSAIIDPTLDTP